MLPRSAADVFPDQIVILMRQRRKSLGRIAHDHLRCEECLSSLQHEAELIRLNAHLYSRLISLITLCSCGEVSAVCKTQSIAVAVFLGCLRRAEDHSRIVLMARRTSSASDLYLGSLYRHALQISLHRMTSIEINHIVCTEHKIQIAGKQLVKYNLLRTAVADTGTSCNDIFLLHHTVIQFYFDIRAYLAHRNDQRLSGLLLCIVYCRKSRDLIRTFYDLVSLIAEICRTASVLMVQPDHFLPEIADPAGWQFLRKAI